jgi:hypothetical protein
VMFGPLVVVHRCGVSTLCGKGGTLSVHVWDNRKASRGTHTLLGLPWGVLGQGPSTKPLCCNYKDFRFAQKIIDLMGFDPH